MNTIIKELCLLLCLIMGINVMAQQTSLTIDNQSPGWLSSKIGYVDQQTVENLKIVGFINNDDLQFIARLMREHSLHGRLDLEEANIVSTTGGTNNYLENDFNVWGRNYYPSPSPLYLKYLSIPQTLEDGQKNAMIGLRIDTLFINTITGYAKALCATVKHLKIGDNVTILEAPGFSDVAPSPGGKIESIEFPPSLKKISETWNSSMSYNTIGCKIQNGKNLKSFPSLEKLVASFSIEEMPDSVFLPKIRVLSLNQYHAYHEKSMFKSGMHVFIGKNIEKITDMSHAKNIHLHFASPKPPVMEASMTYHYQLNNESYFILHVPKGSADAYRACFKDSGSKVTIIEEDIDVSNILLDSHKVSLNVGDSFHLSASVSPEDATDNSIKWHSDNNQVAEVNTMGIVTAKKAGKTKIIVSSLSNPEVIDECEIIVIQPAKSIQINETLLTLAQNKGKKQLIATTKPDDTTDKTVLWSSNDTNVATVDSNGDVSAHKAGKCTITATAKSNAEVKATCEVTVIQPVTGITFDETSLTMTELGEMKKLVANVQPEDASNKAVKWTSSNTSVCIVSENGTVVATGYGIATIVATTVDGGFPVACVVSVVQPSQPVTLTAMSYTKVYGEANPAFGFTREGVDLDGVPEITCDATITSSVGTYPIVIKKGSVANNQVTYVNGTLTITKAPLVIRAGNYTKRQGEANPSFKATYDGFKNDETESVLIENPKFSTIVNASTAPGEYVINVEGAEAQNYEISYVFGKLTVSPAEAVVITADNINITYGDAIPELTFSVTGAELKGTPKIYCEANSKSPVGTYPIIVDRGSVSNYNDTYVNGTLTITKAPLTLTPKNYTISQGDALPVFEVTYTGFKNGETESVLTKQPKVTCSVVSSNKPGIYDILVSDATADNYEISCVAGRLGIRDLSALKGDINRDGEVDVTDVVELIDMVLGGIYDPAGDINGDGEVDVTDVVELIDMVLSGE